MTTEINDLTIGDFVNRVDTILFQRETWQQTLCTDSNDALYNMLAEIYSLHEATRENRTVANEAAEYLREQCETHSIKLAKNPTHLQLLVKYVFADAAVNSRRISAYARVLNAAIQSPTVATAADVPVFIRDAGGIEGVRAAQARNTVSPSVRASEGRKLADKRKTLAKVSVDEVSQCTSSVQNSYVTLLGKVNAQGEVEVKYVCYEKTPGTGKTSCASAIKTVLGHLFSNKQKSQKANEASIVSETEARTHVGAIVGCDKTISADPKASDKAA